MTDPRYDAARAKLRRFLPPPPPDSGWGYARQRIEAQFLGPVSDDQATLGEAQLLFPAILSRSDSDPTNWDNDAHNWIFSPTVPAYSGAQGDWLDLWGKVLGVPREPGESDALYGPRILGEILSPTTTNIGLAQAIDQGMGVVGTQVVEAEGVLNVGRLNSPELHFNSATTTITKRLNMAGGLGGNDLTACFLIQVPTGIQLPYDKDSIQRIADRRKAAGTRLVGIYMAGGGSIMVPNNVTVGLEITATITPVAGASYNWVLTGSALIDSGQGTNQITFHATAEGTVGLAVLVTSPAGPANYWKPIQAFNPISTVITTPLYQYAGTFLAVASVPSTSASSTIAWTGTGIEFEGPTNTPIVTFDVGVAGTLANLTVTITSATGTSYNSTVQIKSIPYTSPATFTSSSLSPAAFQDFTLDLGWEYHLTQMATDHPALLRVYNTASDRGADNGRSLIADPPTGTNIVFEGATSATQLSFTMPDLYIGTNGDTPRTKTAYCRLFNLDIVSQVINLTLTRTETKTSGTF